MEMHQVRYFLAVARTLNFTRAADDCNVTQPSLTRAIQKLEDELGGLLFHRERALTHLTDLGRLMLPHLERTFESARAAKMLASSVGKAELTPLHLGVARSIVSPVLDTILADLYRSLSGLELVVTSGSSQQLVDLALQGSLDLIVVSTVANTPLRLECWPLFSQKFHVVTAAGHPLAMRRRVTMREIARETWIDCGDDGTSVLRAAAAEAGFEPQFRHRVDSTAQAMRLIKLGFGSALLPWPDELHASFAVIEVEDQATSCDITLSSIAGRQRCVAADALVRAAQRRSLPRNMPVADAPFAVV